MCCYKEDGVLQVFAAILKKLSAQGTNKVDYGKHILKGMVIWGGKIVTFMVRNFDLWWAIKLNLMIYRIYSAIRRGFHLSRMTTNNLISSM